MLGRVAGSRRTTALTLAAPAVLVLSLTGCVGGGHVTPAPMPPPTTTTVPGQQLPLRSSTSETRTDTSAGTGVPPSTGGSTGATSTASPTSTATGGGSTATGRGSTGTSTGWACTAALGDGCGAYSYPGIPNSNGANTYVSNQSVGPQPGTSQTLRANSPGDWQLLAHAVPLGYRGVQTFPDAQQLFNGWCGSGWGDCATPGNTPLDSLSTLKVSYSETSPPDSNSINEFAVDVWSDGYGSDIMFWTDTHGRCDEGAFGDTLLGHAVLGGQKWTVHRYGEAGAEVIFVLDGPGGPGTCAQESSGTVDVKAGLDWLTAHGFATGPHVISQVNTGWEITSADDATFTMHRYAIQAVPR